MAFLQLADPNSLPQSRLLQIALYSPPAGWEKVFKAAEPELQLACFNLSQLGPYYPPVEQVFRCFQMTPLQNVKVVILGQDPYHTPGQANGLCFACNTGTQPSVNNMYEELERTFSSENITQAQQVLMQHLHLYQKQKVSAQERNLLAKVLSLANHKVFRRPEHANLDKWAQQGVLLWNPCLTVTPHEAGSHVKKGLWNGVSARVFEGIAEANPECVYVLLGKHAIEAGYDKAGQRAIKLCATHPSPFSARKDSKDAPAFIGSGIFREVNEYLLKQGKTPIDWTLD